MPMLRRGDGGDHYFSFKWDKKENEMKCKSAKQQVFEAAMKWHNTDNAIDHAETWAQKKATAIAFDKAEYALTRACAAAKKAQNEHEPKKERIKP